MNGVRCLVTSIGGIGVGDQITKALRMTGEHHLVGCDVSDEVAQRRSVDQFVRLPRADNPSYVDRLLVALDDLRIDAAFCGSEAELVVWNRHRSALEESGAMIAIGTPFAIDTAMNKQATDAFLRSEGFNVPRSLVLAGMDDIDLIDFFPVIVKPSSGGGGSRDVFLAQSRAELEALLTYLGRAGSLIQEYIGTPDSEFTVGVLHDLDGRFINSIAVKRLLTSGLNVRSSQPNRTTKSLLGEVLVISSGISHGWVGRFPEVTRQCEPIAEAIGPRGPMNIQCRLVGDEVFVFEINPRFSGTTSIRALMGFNEPQILIQTHITGEAVPERFEYRTGLVLRSLVESLVQGHEDG